MTGPPVVRRVVAACGLAAAAACARQEMPPGGPPDVVPPLVVSVTPEPFAEGVPTDQTVRIGFSERISERPSSGDLADAVLVSPETGEIKVGRGSRELEVSAQGGWIPGQVYRVSVLPVVRDLFGNTMPEIFEFVFSTGGELTDNAAVGVVIDRITGAPRRGYRVQAVSVEAAVADSANAPRYLARTDSAGVYALRYLPPGAYTVEAFDDGNGDGRPGPREPQGRTAFELGAADTTFADMVVIAPDTIAPRLASGEVAGPVLVRLLFDDYVDPDSSLAVIGVLLEREDGEPGAPLVTQLLHEHRLLALQAAAGPRPADPDSAAAAGRPAFLEGGPYRAVGRGTGLDSISAAALGVTLPSRAVYAVLSEPLPEDVPHRLILDGIANVSGVAGGIDTVTVTREAPAEVPDSPTTPDTLTVPDTLPVPDTVTASGGGRRRR